MSEANATPVYSISSEIIAYEEGELEYDEVVVLFQKLIDTGMINHLQGSYGRQAMQFIHSGECHS